jgi:hypothetical protein
VPGSAVDEPEVGRDEEGEAVELEFRVALRRPTKHESAATDEAYMTYK